MTLTSPQCPTSELHTVISYSYMGDPRIDERPAHEQHYKKRCPGCGLYKIWVRKPECPVCGRLMGRHGHKLPRHKRAPLYGGWCQGAGRIVEEGTE